MLNNWDGEPWDISDLVYFDVDTPNKLHTGEWPFWVDAVQVSLNSNMGELEETIRLTLSPARAGTSQPVISVPPPAPPAAGDLDIDSVAITDITQNSAKALVSVNNPGSGNFVYLRYRARG